MSLDTHRVPAAVPKIVWYRSASQCRWKYDWDVVPGNKNTSGCQLCQKIRVEGEGGGAE